MVADAFNPSTRGRQVIDRWTSASSRPAWPTKQISAQLELQGETLSGVQDRVVGGGGRGRTDFRTLETEDRSLELKASLVYSSKSASQGYKDTASKYRRGEHDVNTPFSWDGIAILNGCPFLASFCTLALVPLSWGLRTKVVLSRTFYFCHYGTWIQGLPQQMISLNSRSAWPTHSETLTQTKPNKQKRHSIFRGWREGSVFFLPITYI